MFDDTATDSYHVPRFEVQVQIELRQGKPHGGVVPESREDRPAEWGILAVRVDAADPIEQDFAALVNQRIYRAK